MQLPDRLSDGKVAGRWKRTLNKGAAELAAILARPLSADERAGLDAAGRRYGEFLGLPAAWRSVE